MTAVPFTPSETAISPHLSKDPCIPKIVGDMAKAGRLLTDTEMRGPNYSIISTLRKSITAVMRRTAAGRGGIIDHAKRTHRCLNCDDNGRGGIGSQGQLPLADAQPIRRSDLL
jgi:hypothetical protein